MFSWSKIKSFNFFFYIIGSALKSCLIQKWFFLNLGSIFGGLKIVFLGLAVLVFIVNGVCPLLLPLVSLWCINFIKSSISFKKYFDPIVTSLKFVSCFVSNYSVHILLALFFSLCISELIKEMHLTLVFQKLVNCLFSRSLFAGLGQDGLKIGSKTFEFGISLWEEIY